MDTIYPAIARRLVDNGNVLAGLWRHLDARALKPRSESWNSVIFCHSGHWQASTALALSN